MAGSVQAVERAFTILKCFASSSTPLTIGDVAGLTGLPRATTYRLIHTLESDGYLHQDGKTFCLGKRVLALGFARLHRRGLAVAAQPVLDQLASQSGQTVVLSMLPQDGSANKIVIGAVARASGALSVVVEVGQQLKAADTVLANAVFANAVLPDALRPKPDSSAIRAIHVGTHGPEAAVQAIATPVHDFDGQPIASLAIVMPARRMTEADIVQTYSDILCRVAGQLGY